MLQAKSPPARLGFLASHGGSGARAIAAASAAGELNAVPVALASNNSDSAALAWARAEGLVTAHLSRAGFADDAALDAALTEFFAAQRTDLLILSGYMKVLGEQLLRTYSGRILNIHPSLLPRHGGRGMYGDHVHAAVLAAGDTVSGASVHLVTGGVDEGPLLAQSRVPVEPGDTVADLRARVQATEGPLYVQAVRQWLQRGE